MATTDKKLHHLTIHEAGQLLKAGELSPVELTQIGRASCRERV